MIAPNNPPTESVWDYPRPPRLEPTSSRILIHHQGVLIANTTRALRLLETSHPPVFYIPPTDIALQFLTPSTRHSSFCEFKGSATYWNIDVSSALDAPSPSALAPDAAWSYARPSPSFAALHSHLAFYASRLDQCTVDGECVTAQPGDFYGGWITSRILGPFKGPPGTLGW